MNSPRLLTHRDGLAFVCKPAGMPTHRNAEGVPDLVGWLLEQGRLLRGTRPVHRLDRDTSGVLLCAERPQRAMASAWFESGEVTKTYLALVHGRMHATGTISAPIDGQEASTEVTLVESLSVAGRPLSLVSLTPRTGRRHQLRRHLLHIRHPILGDRRYHSRRAAPIAGAPQRLWLHAAVLAVPGRPPVEAPLPQALQEHLTALRAAPST